MSEKQEQKNEDIREFGQVALNNNRENNRISLLTIIGEIEGHDCLPATTKTTKYEHVLPKLAEMEDNRDTEGILLLLNTVGGDVESGLAIAEMMRRSANRRYRSCSEEAIRSACRSLSPRITRLLSRRAPW